MRNIIRKIYNWMNRHLFISTVLLIGVIGSAVYLTVMVVSNLPKPLGSAFEYLGKEDYGCWYPLCTTKPTSYLYYGTDMDQNGVARLTASTPGEAQPVGGADDTETYNMFDFSSARGAFTMTYYAYPQAVIRAYDLKSTHKKYVISINISEYDTVRRSLQSQ